MTDIRLLEFETEFYIFDSSDGLLSSWVDLEAALEEIEALTGSRDGSRRIR